MLRISLAALAIFASILLGFSQSTQDSSLYKNRRLKTDEVNFVSSYYRQDGNNSAVTGGIGTEKLTDFATTIDNVSFLEIIKEISRECEDLIRKKKATIITTKLGTVRAVRFQFHQLIQNLISNSLKFSRPGIASRIQIKNRIVRGPMLKKLKLSPLISYNHIRYTDNGIGFKKQYSEKIFEVFQRLHSQQEYKGTGIGLAICKRIVENHQGIIQATGEESKGATFDIYIPAA